MRRALPLDEELEEDAGGGGSRECPSMTADG